MPTRNTIILELAALIAVLCGLASMLWYVDSLHTRIDLLEENVLEMQESCPGS